MSFSNILFSTVRIWLLFYKTQQTWKTDNENIDVWLLFFLEIIKQQIEKAIKISQKEDIEPLLSQIQIQVWNFINQHQECSRQEIVKSTKISESTIKQAIKKLIDMKKIIRLGATKNVRYKVFGIALLLTTLLFFIK